LRKKAAGVKTIPPIKTGRKNIEKKTRHGKKAGGGENATLKTTENRSQKRSPVGTTRWKRPRKTHTIFGVIGKRGGCWVKGWQMSKRSYGGKRRDSTRILT